MCFIDEDFNKHEGVWLAASMAALLGKCLKDESEVLG